jgi:hypothetical protein
MVYSFFDPTCGGLVQVFGNLIFPLIPFPFQPLKEPLAGPKR